MQNSLLLHDEFKTCYELYKYDCFRAKPHTVLRLF